MYFQSKAAIRFAFLRNPGSIVIGYILTLFAIVGGAAAFPSSTIWMTLLFVVVGAFFVVAVPILVMTYLFFTWKFFTVLRSFARRFCFGTVRRLSKSSRHQKDPESHVINAGLWDRWIDGFV